MSYDSRLEGTLALDPPPDPAVVAELRAAIEALASSRERPDEPRSGWKLTPLGGGLVNEDDVDWEAQLAWLDDARRQILAPRGIALMGRLEAIGEDDARIAVVNVDPSGVSVEQAEGDEEVDPRAWIALLADGDEGDRRVAAEQLAAHDAAIAVPALAGALADPSADVRRCALESLGAFEEEALPALDAAMARLSDEDPFVRYWATFALGRMGKQAAPALGRLEELTRDTAEGPRYGAIDAIRRIRG